MKKIKYITLGIAMVIMAFVITGCGPSGNGSGSGDEPVSKTGFCLNTTCDIKIYGIDQAGAQKLLDGAFDLMTEYENMLSKTVEGSDVYKINHADGAPVQVSDDTMNVLTIGMQMGDYSGGLFDITIGAITDMWDFTGDNPKVPDDADIKAALPAVDYKKLKINGNEVTLGSTGAQLDLGGVAKGYIADKVTEYLESEGVTSALINLGGNVVTIGSKPDGAPFVIGIERPYSDRTEIVGTISVTDTTVVTSGIYERKFEEDGVLYHHVLDPRTGYPSDSELESVTIRAAKGNSGFCDGLSTVCLMLGEKDAKELIAMLQDEYPDMHLEASFINKDDQLSETDGMDVTKTK